MLIFIAAWISTWPLNREAKTIYPSDDIDFLVTEGACIKEIELQIKIQHYFIKNQVLMKSDSLYKMLL